MQANQETRPRATPDNPMLPPGPKNPASFQEYANRYVRREQHKQCWQKRREQHRQTQAQQAQVAGRTGTRTRARRSQTSGGSTGSRGGTGNGGSGSDGDGGSDDPDPEPPVLNYRELARRWAASPRTLANIFSRDPAALPPHITLPGARGPRWRIADVEAFESTRRDQPDPPPRKRGRPRSNRGPRS